MKHREFIDQLRDEQITAAIGQAEQMTSGEIRVFVSRKAVEDTVAAAGEQFVKLGMTATAERNGVLIYVAPRSRSFAVVGDEGIHGKCGEDFWQKLAEEMGPHFAAGEYTKGIVHGVLRAGALLAEHFPRTADDRNELPDRLERD
jgi:uncharacterized membrane protein